MDLFKRLEINDNDNDNDNNKDYDKEILEILIAFCQSKEGLDEIVNLDQNNSNLSVTKKLLDKLFQTQRKEIKHLLLQFAIMFVEHSNSTTNNSRSNTIANGIYDCHILSFLVFFFLYFFDFCSF